MFRLRQPVNKWMRILPGRSQSEMATVNTRRCSEGRRQFIRLVLVSGVAAAFNPKLSLAKGPDLNGYRTAAEAYALAKVGTVKLIDIRSPDEWRQTGIGEGAVKISMHEPGFISRVDALLDGDRSRPIALICARGNRSRRMKSLLNEAGFTNVINVSEGMLGSEAGAGWLKRKLPVNE